MSRLAATAWALALATVLHDRRSVPDLVAGAAPPGAPPTISVIVPARDEAHAVGATLRGVTRQTHPGVQVVAVDDESRDGTRRAMAAVAGVELVDGAPPPPGWAGKSWACHQGAQRATGDWLLFLDADVALEPGAVAAALALAARLQARGLTAFPRLLTGTPAERAVLPLAAVLMETVVFPSWAARARWTGVAIGVGGFLLLERGLYDALGGHAAVRGEIVEDLALARAAKRAGHLLPWAHGEDLLSLRFYRGPRDMWRGFRKNASRGWDAPLPLAVAGGALAGTAVLAPWVAAARRRPSGLAGVALQAATLGATLRGTDIPPGYALAAPAGWAFLGAVGLASALDRVSGRGTTWRGRRIRPER